MGLFLLNIWHSKGVKGLKILKFSSSKTDLVFVQMLTCLTMVPLLTEDDVLFILRNKVHNFRVLLDSQLLFDQQVGAVASVVFAQLRMIHALSNGKSWQLCCHYIKI